jgi:1,4-dihydroxy-2-naphthoate octaprenyltransferase
MNISRDNDIPMGRASLITTLGDYFARYRMALYLVFATTVSLSIAWNFPSATAVSLGTEIA